LTLWTAIATGQITDNEREPWISIQGWVTVLEGKQATNKVTLSRPSATPIMVDFTTLNGSAIALAQAQQQSIDYTAMWDSTFMLWEKISWWGIYKLQVLENNKILIAGSFTSYDGQSIQWLIMLNADGTQDTSFNVWSWFNSNVRDFALQTDGKIIVWWWFTQYKWVAANRILRLNADGSRDESFAIGSWFDQAIYTVAVLPDESIIVWWTSNSYKDTPFVGKRLVRLSSSWELLQIYNNLPSFAAITTLKVIDMNTIYVGTLWNGLHKVSAAGVVDTWFGANLPQWLGSSANINAIELQADGKIMIWWSMTFVRLQANGTQDTTFTPTVAWSAWSVSAMMIEWDGTMHVAIGWWPNFQYNNTTDNWLLQIWTTGALIQDYSIKQSVQDIVRQPDGKLLIGGEFTAFGSRHVARIELTAWWVCMEWDYLAKSWTVVFMPWVTEIPIVTQTIHDQFVESSETYYVVLSNPVGSNILQATWDITITDIDQMPTMSIATGATVTEWQIASLAVTLSQRSCVAVSASFTTNNGTATAWQDYTAKSGVVTLAIGTTWTVITGQTVTDITYDPNETFTFTLSNPQQATLANATWTITILDAWVCGNGIVGDSMINGINPATWQPYEGLELCDDGELNGVACDPLYGWSWCSYCTSECFVVELNSPFCGDGELQEKEGEQCDLGAWINGPGSGCSSTCQLETPTCEISIVNAEPIFSWDLVTFAITGVNAEWMDFVSLTFGDGASAQNLNENNLQYTHTYTSGGVFTATLLIANIASPQSTGITMTWSCSVAVEVNHCIDLGITWPNNEQLTTCDCEQLQNWCIWLEPVCPVSFGSFGYSTTDQYKNVTFGQDELQWCNIILHDYFDNGTGVRVDISATWMIWSVNTMQPWIQANDLSIKLPTPVRILTVQWAPSQFVEVLWPTEWMQFGQPIELFGRSRGSEGLYGSYWVSPQLQLRIPALIPIQHYEWAYTIDLHIAD
jgi:uncharacterized delta-60 repeat protein